MTDKSQIIVDFVEVILLYLVTLVIYYHVTSNLNRFFIISFLYIISLLVFKINYKLGLFYFILAIGAALTEHIFIKYLKYTWDYRKPDVLLIPYWLIPLWALAIIVITQLSKIFNSII